MILSIKDVIYKADEFVVAEADKVEGLAGQRSSTYGYATL